MKKLIMRMYGVACILFLFLFLYGLVSLRISIDRVEALRDYVVLNNYSISEVQDNNAPMGEKKIIRFRVKDIKGDYNTLFFLTKHQNVRVTIGQNMIYELHENDSALCPDSPGVVYNDISLSEEDNLREIVIELEHYYNGINPTPTLMLGTKSAIIKNIVYENLPIMILCCMTLLIGFSQLAIAVMSKKHEQLANRKRLYHAIFIILVGLWKMFDCNLFALQAAEHRYFPVLAVLIFMTTPLMMTKVIRDHLDDDKKAYPWIVADGLSMAGIVAMLILQFTGIMDFWAALWIERLCLIIAFLCIALVIVRGVREKGWTKEYVTGTVITIFAFVWIVTDLITYYVAGGVTEAPFSMLLFVLFLGILLFNRIQLSKKGMEEGMQARKYRKLAFHDALTGFFNRAAFVDYTTGPEFHAAESIMLAFDLNNLKKCNDELGHDKGDLYIKESAKIIMDCFGEGGRCYRLGGDEFSAILERGDIADCEKRIQMMNDRVERFNRVSQDIHMGIACGYAKFDPNEDEDIHATIRRADKMMYEVKFAMKQKEAQEGTV